MILQVAINIHCAPRGALLVEDGMMGSRTIIAVNNADTSLLLTGMQEVSAQHYQEIARKNPSEEQYLQGWLRRASELPRESDAVTA
jgi:lysozyme family protein